MSETIQYIIVGIVLMASAIWIVVKFLKKKQGRDQGCCGCSLQDACKNKQKKATCCDKPTIQQ